MAEIGQTLGGRYRLVELLGSGGMATIYRATDTGLGRDVALKLLRPEYLRDPDFSSRFRQEAQSAASLSHPNVVTVYDYGEDPSGPYIVMELVDGEDLATILRRSGPLPPRQVARIGAGVARALAAAHARGLVHRDVKPGNVLLQGDHAYLTDFGLSKLLDSDASRLTAPGRMVGTAEYLSPEQIRGEPVTGATDTYSLGCVIFECVQGGPPFGDREGMNILWGHLQDEPPDPAKSRTDISPAFSHALKAALRKEPAERPITSVEYARSLSQAAGIPTIGPAG